MNTRKMFFLLFACLFSSQVAASSVTTHVVVFGDSLSDAGMNTWTENSGNNIWATSEGKTGAPITNLDPTTGTHPLWVNWLIASRFPAEKLFPWRLVNTRQMDPATNSVNYAFASAETGDNYLNDISAEAFPPYVNAVCQTPGKMGPELSCVPGVLKQVQLYLDAVHHPDSQTVFIFWAGGNDIFNNVTKALSLFSHKKLDDISHLVESTLTLEADPDNKPLFPTFSHPALNLLKAKDLLIAAGAKPEQIYVLNLPDISKTPAAIHIANGSNILLKIMHEMTVGYNKSLSLALAHNIFNKNNLPESHVLSVYDLFADVINHPAQYKMTYLTDDCVSDGKDPLCTGYVFFNGKHPTVETGKIVAKWLEKNINTEMTSG